jgi:hypothetical protein
MYIGSCAASAKGGLAFRSDVELLLIKKLPTRAQGASTHVAKVENLPIDRRIVSRPPVLHTSISLLPTPLARCWPQMKSDTRRILYDIRSFGSSAFAISQSISIHANMPLSIAHIRVALNIIISTQY